MNDTLLPHVRVSRAAKMVARRWVRRAARFGAAAEAAGYRDFLCLYYADWASLEYRVMHLITAQLAGVPSPGYVRWGCELPHGCIHGDVLLGRPVWGAGGPSDHEIEFKRRLDKTAVEVGIKTKDIKVAWTRGGIKAGAALALSRDLLRKVDDLPRDVILDIRDWARRAGREARPDNPVQGVWEALTAALEKRLRAA